MADLVVITPSRGRPRQLAELAHTVRTTTDGRVEVVGLVDDDDPQRATYKALPCDIWTGPRKSLSGWTNFAARVLLDGPPAECPRFLASMGDDHRPRTRNWDLYLIAAIEALGGSGWAYGSDLLQGENLPTAWVVSADVTRALGWMMLPACAHMYVDTAVGELGRATGLITYRPDVAIEHLHPLAGKADWDDTYLATNSAAQVAADHDAFEAWRRDGLVADVDRVLVATAARVGG
jgi:hypothetical protein